MFQAFNKLQNKKYEIVSYEINNISLSCFDDKKYILNNKYDELILGY